MSQLDELKKEATELGVTFSPNIGEAKLQEKIDAFYESQETSSAELQTLVEKVAEEDQAPAEPKLDPKLAKRMQREKAAKELRVVTVIDNDQRVNNNATTCTVNCSNEFFDLGTVILPLNEKIEVRVGHIKVLQEVRIPLHQRDTKTGLSTVKMRPRFTVSFEDRSA